MALVLYASGWIKGGSSYEKRADFLSSFFIAPRWKSDCLLTCKTHWKQTHIYGVATTLTDAPSIVEG